MQEPARLYRGETIEMRRADQRERLLAAAREVFAHHGLHGASVEQIVAAARVSRTAFYRLWANKEECMLAVVAEGNAKLAAVLRLVIASSVAGEAMIRNGIRALVKTYAENPAMARVMTIEAVGATPELERERLAVRAGYVALLQEQMQRSEGWHDRPAAEVRLVAMATIAAISETVAHLVATELQDWEQAAAYLGDYAVRALTAPPDP
jgi:AcrR family transcriptional regulator